MPIFNTASFQVLIPGDPEREAHAIRITTGIPVKAAVIADMKDIIAHTNVTFDFWSIDAMKAYIETFRIGMLKKDLLQCQLVDNSIIFGPGSAFPKM